MADFIAKYQGMESALVQRKFLELGARLKTEPLPQPGATTVSREIKTGGRNE
jgi:hypothetical protein